MNTKFNVSGFPTAAITNTIIPEGVGEREWLYASNFMFDKNAIEDSAELVFEGLDTVCSVYLVSILPANTVLELTIL